VVAGVGIALAAPAAMAVDTGGGGAYWHGPDGKVWRNGDGECWRTPEWTAEKATKECDPQLAKENQAPAAQEIAANDDDSDFKAFEKPELVRRTLDASTFFAFDSARLTQHGRAELDSLARTLGDAEQLGTIRISGFTDRIGPEAYNRKLSRQRAQAVADYLAQTAPLKERRFQIVGKGEAQPRKRCDDIKGDALLQCLAPNRRVEVQVQARVPADKAS
jgi:OOP family OmpA-OmpF porin